MIYIAKPLIGKEEKDAVLDILDSGMVTEGKITKEFEKKFAEFVGSKYAVATDSGTSALHVSLLCHGVGKDDEVITTPFTFVASVNSIKFVEAKPVFVDIDEDTFNMNPDLIEEKITSKTKAILPVHLYGNPCDMNKINEIAKKHNLVVIEDACQAHGSSIDNNNVGSVNTTCFSFHPTKNMTTVMGGMLTTNDENIAKLATKLKLCGESDLYYYDVLGYNYRMPNVSAAIGLEQLKKLPEFNKKRIENAKYFDENIKVNGIVLPKVNENSKHVYHQYTIKITKDCSKTRDEVIELLRSNGIFPQVYYPLPIHKQKLYEKDYNGENYPVSERMCNEVLSLPVHPNLTQEDLNKIVNTLNEIK
jgi:dTDP-4-amino-4,6-dideoxygalactose transaminase